MNTSAHPFSMMHGVIIISMLTLLPGCAEPETNSGWSLTTTNDNAAPPRFFQYGEEPDDFRESNRPTTQPAEDAGERRVIEDTYEPPPITETDILVEDSVGPTDIVAEVDTNWVPPTTVCIGIAPAEPVEFCPPTPEPETPPDEEDSEADAGSSDEENETDLSYSLFEEDTQDGPDEEPDPCLVAPNTCIGAPMPYWKLCDFQPQSCGFEALYSLDPFKGHVTVVSLFASW